MNILTSLWGGFFYALIVLDVKMGWRHVMTEAGLYTNGKKIMVEKEIVIRKLEVEDAIQVRRNK